MNLDKKLIVWALLGMLMILPATTAADQLTHKFKSPSFSGIGTGAHYLTIENQEKSRKDKIKDDAIKVEAILNKIEKNRIFEFRTISQLIKRYNKPEDSIKKTINVL